MKQLKKIITIFIVTKNRSFELERLLRSLSFSAKRCKEELTVHLGIENNSYKNIKNLRFLNIKKNFFKEGTSPIYIKNYFYNLDPSPIKVFLDDDVEVREDFIGRLKNHYRKRKNCFISFNPVNFFTKNKEKISKTNLIEFTGFAEIGKKKLTRLILLNFVAEDTELCNRLIKNNHKIFHDNSLQIIHHISTKNRNAERINYNGIANTIEILRGYGPLNNTKNFVDLIYKVLVSVFFYKKFKYINILIEKLFIKNLNIKLFYNKKIILPPYKNYFLNNSSRVNKLKKIKNFNFLEKYVISRTATFEKYQKIEKLFKIIKYVGPKSDKTRINEDYFFCKTNQTSNTFKNLLNYSKKIKKNFNLILCVDDQIIFRDQLFSQLIDKNFIKSLKKVDKLYIYNNKNFYLFEKNKFLSFVNRSKILSIPVLFLSYFLFILIIFPFKFSKKIFH